MSDEAEKKILEELRSLKSEVQELRKAVKSTPSTFPENMNQKQAAEYLNCTPRHLRDLEAEGKITPTRDGKVIYRKKDLDTYLMRHTG